MSTTMRKPHTIPMSTFQMFGALNEIDLSPNEIRRSVKYEDFTWADHIPKPLKFICLNNIADHFTQYPENVFEWITPMNTEYLMETLNIDLPIPLVIHVPDGEYWRRRIIKAWPKFILKPKDTNNLKTIYLTTYVSETICNTVPDILDEAELTELLVTCSPYISTLNCKHLRIPESLSHKWLIEESNGNPSDPIRLDLGYVLTHLKNITILNLVYGPAKITVGEKNIPDLYKFNISDVEALGHGLTISKHLTCLAITKSDLNAIKFNRLLPYLTKCYELQEINFSFCKLNSVGGKSVAHYVQTAKLLKILNLRGNNIGPDVVEVLAFVALWRRNNDYPAIELNLSMNNINDIGAKYLASALGSGAQPFTKLCIRNCNISQIGGINIVQSLLYDRGLCNLALDNNPLNLDVAILLHTMLKINQNITYISIHNCNFPNKMINFLGKVAVYNKYNKRSKLDYIDVEELYDELEKENISEELKLEEEEVGNVNY